jgi:hypothetical protein
LGTDSTGAVNIEINSMAEVSGPMANLFKASEAFPRAPKAQQNGPWRQSLIEDAVIAAPRISKIEFTIPISNNILELTIYIVDVNYNIDKILSKFTFSFTNI